MHEHRRAIGIAVIVATQLALLLPRTDAQQLQIFAADGRDVSEKVARQIEASQLEKASRSPAQAKLDSQLLYAARKERGEPIIPGVPTVEARLAPGPDGRMKVQIDGEITPELLKEIEGHDGIVVGSFPAENAVVALVPVLALEKIAQDGGVRFIGPALDPMTNVGAVESEGDLAHNGPLARHRYCLDGAGVKVGVISDGVSSLGNAQASGDLGPVTVLPGQGGEPGNDEGTAMLEIVHDLAPGAQLYFATGNNGPAAMAANIRALRDAGCKVIVDDLLYSNESPFQDGTIARAVNEVVASGVSYFSSAANSGNKDSGTSSTWEGEFVDGGGFGNYRLNNFGGLNYNYNPSPARTDVALFWNDPLGRSNNDYDLYLTDENGNLSDPPSVNPQNGAQDPFEWIPPGRVGTRILIAKAPAAAVRFLHLETARAPLHFSTEGSTRGHMAAASAFGVAAAPSVAGPARYNGPPGPYPRAFTNTQLVEKFSSDGPRRIFFEPDGTEITPGNRGPGGGRLLQKPDITAADGNATTTPGFAPFFGTSSAAPHAAAIAALLLSFEPTLRVSDLRAALVNSALDIHSTGWDRNSGRGIVMAEPALQAVRPPPIYIHISDTSIEKCYAPEGTVSLKPAQKFFISLNVPSTQPVRVHVKTRDGTARGTASVFNYDKTADYFHVDQDITFNPGETEKLIGVGTEQLCNQRLGTKTFFLDLSNPVGGQLCRTTANGYLYDENPSVVPDLVVRDIQVSEAESGDETGGTVQARFVVSLPAPADFIVRVDYATANGSALAGKDYTTTTGTLVFNFREQHKTISVPILDDGQRGEPDVDFFLNLSNPDNARIGRGQARCVIHDIASPPRELAIYAGSAQLNEGNTGFTNFAFPVRLTRASTNTVTVQWVTVPDSASADQDYEPIGGTITFAPGETGKGVVVRVVGDTVRENDERFFITLSNPTNASLGNSAGVGIIVNDDGGTTSPTPTPTPSATTTPGPSPTPTPTATVGPVREVQNISTRLGVGTGEFAGIGGFIVQGSGDKLLIVRAIGPSLTQAGVSGALADPTLEIFDGSGTPFYFNDDWVDGQRQLIINSGVPPRDNLEAAIVALVPAGNYTAVMRGYNNATGIALVEIYDLDQGAPNRIANISTRGYVGTDALVLIGGFIVGKQSTFVIRALGPSLASFGVASALSDPIIDLYNAQGNLIDSNDDWRDNAFSQLVIDRGLAPAHVRESALIYNMVPGNYTALVRGYNGAVGVGLVEVYNTQQ